MRHASAARRLAPPLRHLTENIFPVELDSVFLQQSDKLRVEIHFLVMLFLIPNITNHDRNHRRAHAECSITFLPAESVTFLRSHREEFDLMVATAFDNANIGGT